MTASLAEYYATNYSRCQIIDDSFLSSWQGLAYLTHAIQVIGFPVQVLTSYLISKKSSKAMKALKGPLTISHYCVSMCDFSLCSLLTPYYFLPHLAGFNVGILNLIHVPAPFQLILICLSILAMMNATVALFESRSSSISANRLKIRRRTSRMVYYAANFAFQSPLLALLLLDIPDDQERAKLDILKLLPCPTAEFFTSPTYVITTDPVQTNYVLFFCTPAILLSFLSQIMFHSSCCVYYLYFSTSLTASSQTRRLQIQYFRGVALQCSIPFTVFAFPYLIAFVALLINRFTQTMLNMLVIVFGLHGIAESVTIILVHKSYRESVKEMFVRRKPADPSTNGFSKELSVQIRKNTVAPPTLT